MSNVPVELIVAAFRDERTADEALKALKQARREGVIGIKNAAVLVKDQGGKLRIRETGDMSGRKGSVLGGAAGAVVGLIAGPALVVPAAVGALIGGLSAKLRDAGFPDAKLKQIGEGLKPGSSAIIAVVEHRWVEQVQQAMARAAGDVMVASLQDDIARQLEAGPDVAYSALATQQGYVLSRKAGNDKEVEGSMFIVGEDEVVGGRYIATEEGFAVVALQADESGAVVVAAEGKPVEEAGAQPEATPPAQPEKAEV
ncbi:MAG: DUF1269 domain-containing protein [Chloroflexales bacterium]|nr:DUF1269 domain-containing protein [Chloroflexales bacterium]